MKMRPGQSARRVVVAVLAALGLVGAVEPATAAGPPLDLGAGLTIVDVAVEDGMVLAVLAPSLKVFAPVGSSVDLALSEYGASSTVSSDETRLGHHGWSTEDVLAMFTALDSGADALDALRLAPRTASSDPDMAGTLRTCHEPSTPMLWIKGCSYVDYGDDYKDAGGRHQADASYASARAKAGFELNNVKTNHSWGENHEMITESSPKETRTYGACDTDTVSVSYAGASIGRSSLVCPAQVDPFPFEKIFSTTWSSSRGVRDETRYVHQANSSTIPRSGISGFSHTLSADTEPYTWCGSGPLCDFITILG